MALQETIHADVIAAMKIGDTKKRDTLRLLENALANEAIAHGAKDTALDDAAIVAIVQRLIKQRRESAAQYRVGGREELAAGEEQEIALLMPYVPAQMDDQAIRATVQEIITARGATGASDMGAVMGSAMAQLRGRADGTRVKAIVAELLSS